MYGSCLSCPGVLLPGFLSLGLRPLDRLLCTHGVIFRAVGSVCAGQEGSVWSRED